MMGIKKVRRKEQLMIQSRSHHVSNMVNSEMYRSTLFGQIRPNATKLIGRHFRVQTDDSKQSYSNSRIADGKETEYCSVAKSVT